MPATTPACMSLVATSPSPTAGITFFGNHSSDGLLYELLDEDLKVLAEVTMEGLIADWQANS